MRNLDGTASSEPNSQSTMIAPVEGFKDLFRIACIDAARERIGHATQAAAIAELSASLSDRIVQPLAAVVANGRAALNWLSSDNLNISQANVALQEVLRDGMSFGNIVHEMRHLFDHRRPNPRAIDLQSRLNRAKLIRHFVRFSAKVRLRFAPFDETSEFIQ